ncbi:MAG: rhomboid family intramembrane serine protease [Proteobacteria bacterium]|nr:rhomboid family intramembrane serine protease [Pseudomonadota bacterium]
MFFPLKDENPTDRPPIVTLSVIVICTLVFFWEKFSGQQGMAQIAYQYGLIPSNFLGLDQLGRSSSGVSPTITLFTSMFLHGGWMHLIGNMWFMWIFGNNIEDELGHVRFILFYLVCGLAAAFLQMALNPESTIPMIGASGAISGVLGAYLLLYPRTKILTLIFLGFFITTARIAAGWFLGIWFGLQAFYAFASAPGDGGGIAFWAHVGGFMAGLGLIMVMRRGGPPIFSRARFTPKRELPKPEKKRRDDNIHRGPWG